MNNEQISNLRGKAEQGDAEAQYNLGTLYFRGQSVPQDYTIGAAVVRESSDSG